MAADLDIDCLGCRNLCSGAETISLEIEDVTSGLPSPPAENVRETKTARTGLMLGCITAPLICLVVLIAWTLISFLAAGTLGPYFGIVAFFAVPTTCVTSAVLGAATGYAVSQFTSIFRAAGWAVLISLPFSIAVGSFCSGGQDPWLILFGLSTV